MDPLLYVYAPLISAPEVHSLLQALQDSGYSITHLGKKDPPKKWSGTLEEAEATVLSGSDTTLYSHIRDANRRLDMTIEIHRDIRWKHSTISVSLPEEEPLRSLGACVAGRIRSFAIILGRSGAGKNQAWQVLRLSDDCPADLAAGFSKGLPIQPPQTTPGSCAPLRV